MWQQSAECNVFVKTNDLIRTMMKPLRPEWPTLALILGTYAGWALAGWLIYPVAPVAATVLMVLTTAMHSSLVHEAVHGHPTRSALVNELLMTPNPGLIWPYRRFKRLHLQHHNDDRLTDPFDDPESYYRAAWFYDRLPRPAKRLLCWSNTLLGRMVLGPLLGALALVASDAAAILRGDDRVMRAWTLHALGLVPVIMLVHVAFGMPLWLYAVTVVWPAAAIISLRTFAEHRWFETPEGRTIIVERSALGLLFLNNNLHLVHHTHPGTPWYDLPRLYRAHREDWHARNSGYVFTGYWPLIRSYLLRRKEPVVHPAWRRTAPLEEAGPRPRVLTE